MPKSTSVTVALLLFLAATILVASPTDSPADFRLTGKFSHAFALSPPLQTDPDKPDKKKADEKKEGDKGDSPQVDIPRKEKLTPPRSPKPLRGLLECGLIVGLSQANYWRRYINWVEDWQFKLNWHDQRRRLFSSEGWRFDSNAYLTNWGHSIAGAVYYNTYRTNYLPWYRSFFYGSMASLYWETLVEWREVISVNDNIFTMLGGLPLGETLFQTSRFLISRKGWLARVAGNLVDPLLFVNRWIDRRKGLPVPEFSGHRFRLSVGQRSGENLAGEQSRSFVEFGLDADLVRVPGFGAPGRLEEWRNDVLSTRLDVRLAFGREGIEDYEVRAETMPWGWVWQNLAVRDGRLRGHSLLAGLTTAFELSGQRAVWEYDQKNPFFQPWDYNQIPLPTRFTDKYSAIHLFGPRVQWRYRGRGFTWTASAETTLDFAMVGAFALNEYTRLWLDQGETSPEDTPLEGMKSTLANYGYYYGLGLSTALEMELRVQGGLELSAWLRTWVQNSVEGLDRFAKDIQDDMNIHDSRLRLGVAFGYRFPGSPVLLRLVFEQVNRYGRMESVVRREGDSRLSVHLVYGF